MMYNESSMAKGWLCVCVCVITAHDSGIRTYKMNLIFALETENKNKHWASCITFSAFVVCVKVFDLHSEAASIPSRDFQHPVAQLPICEDHLHRQTGRTCRCDYPLSYICCVYWANEDTQTPWARRPQINGGRNGSRLWHVQMAPSAGGMYCITFKKHNF